MKNLPYIVALVWFVQVISCRGQEHNLQMQRVLLTSVQMDSLRNLNGKESAKSLWEIVFGDTWPPQPIHFLSGNLDEDAAQEIVLWYKMETIGQAICLDHRGDVWEEMGTTELNFFHGATPPRIDSKARMLLCYGYGWGSGYGSEVLHFYESRNDSLVCVFRLLEHEWSNVSSCDASRIIDARYNLIGGKKILTTYTYRVVAGENSRHMGRTVFEKKITVLSFWNASENLFVPKFPAGLSEYTDEGDILDGQYSFDYFFSPALDKIKWKGPRWKRRALGNPFED